MSHSIATCVTDDGGFTWADISNFTGGGVDIRVSQDDRFDVVKAAGSNVWTSPDGGRNWTPRVLTGTMSSLDRAMTEPDVILTGTDQGLYKSSDGGQSFGLLSIKGLNPSVSSLAIDPSDADSYFVGTDHGVFHSSDGGLSWTLKNTGLIRRTLTTVEISGSEPTEMLIAAADGPYISGTSGDAWTLSKEGLGDPSVFLAAISPVDPNLFYVATADGLYRSENKGVTWSEPGSTFGSDYTIVTLDADPFDANVVMASLSGTRGTYRSEDRGATWAPVNVGLPFTEPTDLAFARDVAERAFIGFETDGVYRSEDRGDSWNADGLQGLTVVAVAPAPSDSRYIYVYGAETAQLYYRNPGVANWTTATTGPARPILDIAVDPNNPLTAYAGTDHSGVAGETGGVYKTTDGGQNWSRIPGVLDSFDVVSVATHPTEPGTVFAATLNAGVYRSTDDGATWEELGNYGTVADLANITIQDPSNPNLLFAGTEGYGVQASADGGRTFVARVTGLTDYDINVIAFDPDEPTTLYAGSDAGIFKSTDSANTWAPTDLSSGEVTDMVTDNEGAGKRIWATVVGEGVAYSGDGGVSFSMYSTGLASLELTSIEVEDTGTGKRIWATMHGGDGIAYSDDLGQTWVSAAGNGLTDRDVNDLAIDGTGKRIWATTNGGVFYSDDEGLSWTELSLGLPSEAPVTSVVVDPNTSEVLVSLFSDAEGGVYRGGNIQGVWTAFNNGLGELKVRRLTSDGGHVVDGETLGTTFFAATAGDRIYTAELRTSASNPVTIITTGLSDGELRSGYSATLSVQGGEPPHVWSLVEGALPPGLELEGATGTISGEPGQVGLYAFTVQAADANARTDQQQLSIEVHNPDVPSLSIDNVSVVEGDTGTVDAIFTVMLAPAGTETVTVGYATADGTATAGADYTATAGSLIFEPGVTSQPVTVLVQGDTSLEDNETFVVDLSSATNATIADAEGIGTIVDDDAPPTLSIDDVGVAEGDAGTVNAVFTVSLSRPMGVGVTVDWTTADGTATAGNDYAANSGTLTFLAGTTTQPITVTVNGDTSVEDHETFFVDLSNPSGATIDDGQGQGTIVNDDGIPALSVKDVSANERSAVLSFNVMLSTVSTETVTVDYATSDGTATDPEDYEAVSENLSFVPGERIRTIVVRLTNDNDDEQVETFLVNLSNPSNAPLADAQGQATITDDDWRELSIDSPTVTEGDSGTVDAVFTVSLPEPAVQTVSVDYATDEHTAVAGEDFVATSGTLTFDPGMTNRQIVVEVSGDATPETEESFSINLSSPVNATIVDVQGKQESSWTGYQPRGESPACDPFFSPNSGSYDHENDRLIVFCGSSYQVCVLKNATGVGGEPEWLSLTPLGDGPPSIDLDWHSTVYDSSSNRLILHGGCEICPVTPETWILTNANGLGGHPEWLRLPDAPFGRLRHTAVYDSLNNRMIVFGGECGPNYDPCNDVWILSEANGIGDPAWQELAAIGELPPAGMYSAGAVYDGDTNRMIVFGISSAGSGWSNQVWILTGANGLDGPAQWIHIQPMGSLPTPRSEFSIGWDRHLNRILLFGGDGGGEMLADTWVLNCANGVGCNPAWDAIDANYPADYFVRGVAAYSEAFHRFVVTQGYSSLPGLAHSWVLNLVYAGTGTILDDDTGLPGLFIDDVTLAEGDAGTVNAVFTVTLSLTSDQTITVDYATADGTATAGSDYTPISGQLTFSPGYLTQTIAVPAHGDTVGEPDETFFVNLNNPTNATLADGQGQGTILNDDPFDLIFADGFESGNTSAWSSSVGGGP